MNSVDIVFTVYSGIMLERLKQIAIICNWISSKHKELMTGFNGTLLYFRLYGSIS